MAIYRFNYTIPNSFECKAESEEEAWKIFEEECEDFSYAIVDNIDEEDEEEA